MATDRPKEPTGPRGILCPYCGRVSVHAKRCPYCGGYFDPLSRQATQNAMGPWFIRDEAHPFRPGCSFETIKDMVRRGRITPTTLVRGPTTRQFWNLAGRTPSVANLMGLCHNCRREVNPDDASCRACGASFAAETDRQHLGLAPIHLLPGEAAPEVIAAASLPLQGPAVSDVRRRGDPDSVSPHERPAVGARSGGGHRVAVAVLVIAVVALASGFAAVIFGPRLGWTFLVPMQPTGNATPAPDDHPRSSPEPPPVFHVEQAPNSAHEMGPSEGNGAPEPASTLQVQPPAEAPVYHSPELPPDLWGLLDRDPPDTDGMVSVLERWGAAHPGDRVDTAAWIALAARRAEQFRLRLLP
jgi:RNA polymerase subunit RPABC4/transcription elongation factor Spt4